MPYSMPKVGIIIITYNQPDLLHRQLDCLQRFCKDEYKVIVVDNSTDVEARTAIKYHARKETYIRSKASGTNGSESHAFAANLSFAKYKDDFDYLFWLDHDCFPVAPFSVAEILKDKLAAGLLQAKHKTYFWPGCFMVDASKKMEIDFSVSLGLDTGGGTYKLLEGNSEESFVFFSEVYEQNPYFHKSQYNFYSVIDDKFMHFIAASNWSNANDHQERLNSLYNILQNKCVAA
jgi:glycosyltransferase involved in cell wall biosynthesis